MGNGIRLAPDPAKNAAQSTGTPLVCTAPSAPTTARTSSRSLRSDGTSRARPAVSAAIAVSTPSGPSSRNVDTPSDSSVRTASANRTASRTCRTQ